METNKYVVDQITDNIAVLEKDGEILYLSVTQLPNNIHEGSILIFDDNGFHTDINLEKDKRKNLRERIERLKRLNDK